MSYHYFVGTQVTKGTSKWNWMTVEATIRNKELSSCDQMASATRRNGSKFNSESFPQRLRRYRRE